MYIQRSLLSGNHLQFPKPKIKYCNFKIKGLKNEKIVLMKNKVENLFQNNTLNNLP